MSIKEQIAVRYTIDKNICNYLFKKIAFSIILSITYCHEGNFSLHIIMRLGTAYILYTLPKLRRNNCIIIIINIMQRAFLQKTFQNKNKQTV